MMLIKICSLGMVALQVDTDDSAQVMAGHDWLVLQPQNNMVGDTARGFVRFAIWRSDTQACRMDTAVQFVGIKRLAHAPFAAAFDDVYSQSHQRAPIALALALMTCST